MNAHRTMDLLNPTLDAQPEAPSAVDDRPHVRIVGIDEEMDFETDDWTDLGPDDLEALDDEEHFSLEDAPELLLDAVSKEMEIQERRHRLPRIGRRR